MEELVKRIWECASGECFNCSQYTETTNASVCSKELMKQAADAIEELSAIREEQKAQIIAMAAEDKPRWIPVTERLPEFEGAVLCMRKSNVYGVRPYQEILYVDEYGFKNYDDIYLADGVVTHWMPLPQPPEEGET